MQVSVENTSALERRMTIAVPAERVENEVNKRLQQTAKRAKIAGFRPGKVPMTVIRQRFERTPVKRLSVTWSRPPSTKPSSSRS